MGRAKQESEKQMRELEEAKKTSSSEKKPPSQTPFVARILDPF